MSINVKCAGIDDPIAVEFFRTQSQAVVPFPKNGALAGVIDKDEGLLAGTSGCGEKMRLDTEARKFRAMKRCGAVVPDLAHVARAQAPLLARNHGGCGPAPGAHLVAAECHLGHRPGRCGE